MQIKVYSRGETVINTDVQYQEPVIRDALNAQSVGSATGYDVASAITEYTDTERSDISHDDYAVVTEDDGGLLWKGWLTGNPEAPAPAEASATPEPDELLAMVAYGAHFGYTASQTAEAWRTAYEPERAEWRRTTAALAAGAEAGQ